MVDIGEAVSEVGFSLPSISSSGIIKVIMIILFGLIFLMVVGGAAYLIIIKLSYKKTIRVFETVGNKTVQVLVDKAKLSRLGNAGDFLFICKKSKKVLPKGHTQMGKNEYWYFIRNDGEWINIDLGNVDQVMKTVKVDYVDEDMRLQRLGVQKNLRENFLKLTFMQKWGQVLGYVAFVMVITICLIIFFREMKDTMGVAKSMAASVKEMAVAVNNLATHTGGRVIPA